MSAPARPLLLTHGGIDRKPAAGAQILWRAAIPWAVLAALVLAGVVVFGNASQPPAFGPAPAATPTVQETP